MHELPMSISAGLVQSVLAKSPPEKNDELVSNERIVNKASLVGALCTGSGPKMTR